MTDTTARSRKGIGGGYDPATGQGWPNAVRNARKTHCPRGHPYDAENTRFAYGRRYCKACHRERNRKEQPCPTEP